MGVVLGSASRTLGYVQLPGRNREIMHSASMCLPLPILVHVVALLFLALGFSFWVVCDPSSLLMSPGDLLACSVFMRVSKLWKKHTTKSRAGTFLLFLSRAGSIREDGCCLYKHPSDKQAIQVTLAARV